MPAKRWIPYLIYAFVTLAILSPLLKPGIILTLDSPYALSTDFGTHFFGLDESWILPSLPFDLITHLLNTFMPAWLLQKILIFLLFFLAGIGAHRLVPQNGPGRYLAGLLYMINPFTYVRFLEGQWDILSAYALIPFAVKAFIDLLDESTTRNTVKLILLSTVVGLIEVQGYLYLVLVCFVIFLVWLVKERRQRARIIRTSKYVIMACTGFGLLSLYWLIPTLTSKGDILSQIGQSDIATFAPQATSRIMFDIAALYGFWRGGYDSPQNLLPFWWVLFLVILFLVVYGSLSRNTKLRWFILSFSIIGIVSFVLAVGAASDFTKPVFDWLWQNIYVFHGFRDSQKFVGLLCLVYACIGGLGLNLLVREIKRRFKFKAGPTILTSFVFLIILVYTFTIFGFHGQLGTTNYPAEWKTVNDYLNQDKGDFRVLFLPWHLYMDYTWLPNKDKRLTTPASLVFDKPVVSGDNVEAPGISSQSSNPISNYLGYLIDNKAKIDNLGELLAPLDIKYVILVDEADYQQYDVLYRQTDLSVVLKRPGITLFKNENKVAAVYAVDSVEYISSLGQLLALSKTENVMEHLYVVGNGVGDSTNEGMEAVDYSQINQQDFRIGSTNKKYTIFTVPQNINTQNWEYNGQQPIAENLGFMPVFVSSHGGGEIVYTRFLRVYLPCYIVSGLALGFVLWLYFRRAKSYH